MTSSNTSDESILSSDEQINTALKKLYDKPAYAIPLLSGIAYLIAYTFEAAYLAYFEVSHQFIEITVNVFVLSLCGASLVLIYLAMIIKQLKDIFDMGPLGVRGVKADIQRYLVQYLFVISPIILLSVALSMYLNYSVKISLILIILAVIILPALELLDTLLTGIRHYRKSAGLKSNLRLMLHDRTIHRVTDSFARFIIYGLVAFGSVGSIGIIVGHLYAISRENFVILHQTRQDYVLVRSYPDQYVLTSIKGNKLTAKTLIIPQGNSSMIFTTLGSKAGVKR